MEHARAGSDEVALGDVSVPARAAPVSRVDPFADSPEAQISDRDFGLIRQLASEHAGIAIADPPRRQEILDAVAATGGEVVLVEEEALRRGWQALAAKGVAADPAAGAVQAAWTRRGARARDGAAAVGWLSGAGNRD